MLNKKLVTRVKALLKMSEGNHSANEAAIALRRARQLIDRYQITSADLSITTTEFNSEAYDCKTTRCDILGGVMAVWVAKLNDCRTHLTTRENNCYVVFEGISSDSLCCVLMYTFLIETRNRGAREICFGKKESYEYRKGFVDGVNAQIKNILKSRESLKTSSGTDLVQCKRALVTHRYGKEQYTTLHIVQGAGSVYSKGLHDGTSVGLNRAINKSVRKELTHGTN